MRNRSRFLKSGSFAVIIVLLMMGMAQVAPTQAGAPAQATMAAGATFGPCPPAGQTETEEPPRSSAPGAAGAAVATQQSPSGPRAFLGVQVRPVDDCGAEV